MKAKILSVQLWAYILAGVELCASLADNDVARYHSLVCVDGLQNNCSTMTAVTNLKTSLHQGVSQAIHHGCGLFHQPSSWPIALSQSLITISLVKL